MRFISADDRVITAQTLEAAILGAASGYDIVLDADTLVISHDGATIAQVEINPPDDGLFDAERDELIEAALRLGEDGAGKNRVLETLRTARTMVVARVLHGTGDAE